MKFTYPIALALALASCTARPQNATPARTESAPGIPITAEQAKTIAVEPATIRTVPMYKDAVGKVAFNEDAATPVFTPYTGRILELLVVPGDRVEKGQALFTIDTPDLVDPATDLLTGKAALDKAQTALRLAEKVRARLERLVAGEAAAQRDLDQAIADAQSAQSDIRSAEAQIDSARQRLETFGKTPAEIDAIVTSRRMDRTAKVVSPLGGVIVARKVGPGQFVRPDNPDPAFSIAALDSLWLLAQIYETDLPSIRMGEPVSIRIASFPDDVFTARVTYIAPSVDPATRRISVRCVIQDSRHRLKPEMFATFRLDQPSIEALTVPQAAILAEGNANFVWLSRNGYAIRRPVETGATLGNYVQIRSGLAAGDPVISRGALFLSSISRQ